MVKSFVRKLLILFAAAIVAVYSGCARKEAGKSYREAYEKYEQGLYVEAVNGFLLAVSQGEDSGRIYGDLALSYVKLKEYAKAEDAVGKAIEKAGEDDGTLLRVGLYYLETEDFEKARTYLEQASGAEKKKLSELNLTAIGYLAELDEKETRYEDAIERYKSLISNGFKATESKLFIGECYLRLKQGAAADTYFRWAEQDTLQPSGYLYIYRLYQDAERFADAESYFRKGLDAITQKKSDEMTVGEYYANGRKFSAAEEYLTDETTYGALSAKAYLAMEKGAYEDAERYLTKLIENGENLPEVYNRYFILAIRMQDFTKARQLLPTLRSFEDKTLRKTVDWNEIMMYECELDYRTAYEKLGDYLSTYGSEPEAERERIFLSRVIGA